MSQKVLSGNAVELMASLPAKSFQMCVTSPPYWRLRDYGAGPSEIGQEEDPDQYIINLLYVMREARRLLRDDGVLFLNLGDKVAEKETATLSADPMFAVSRPQSAPRPKGPTIVKPGELFGMPWRVAFAMQADGWYLRQEIIWHKPDVNPETRPGCFARDHEHLFLFSKQPKCWFNKDALLVPSVHQPKGRNDATTHRRTVWGLGSPSLWSIPVARGAGSHFAAFPLQLPLDCILAGTPESACGFCGTPYDPIVEVERIQTRNPKTQDSKYTGDTAREGRHDKGRTVSARKIVGWKAGCPCPEMRMPSNVLDPFIGSGTTGLAAKLTQRDCLGIELNSEYAQQAAQRIAQG